MPAITLSLAGDTGISLVARIYRAVSAGADNETAREVVVPVVGEVTVPVEAGPYTISLLLPTGQTLRESCIVQDDDVQVAFDARGALSVNLSAGDRFSLQGAVLEATGEDLRRAVGAPWLDHLPARVTSGPRFARRRAARSSFGFATSFEISDKPQQQDHGELRSRTALSLVYGADVRGSGSWRSLAAGPVALKALTYEPLDWVDEVKEGVTLSYVREVPRWAERAWLRVTNAKGVELGALPLPWRGATCVAISVNSELSGCAMTDIAIQEPELGALLSYLEQGRLSLLPALLGALEADGTIERFIYSDAPSPLAACAAAYAALAVKSPRLLGRWEQWIPDLADRHEDIPDCAILLARLRMIQPGLEQTLAADSAMVAAHDAGVPYFSTGLGMLRDMLTASADGSEAKTRMLAHVSPVAARCDPARLFTVLRYPRT